MLLYRTIPVGTMAQSFTPSPSTILPYTGMELYSTQAWTSFFYWPYFFNGGIILLASVFQLGKRIIFLKSQN